jgi:pimeloyl-ACP methyl ester carboxylesterase
MTADAFSEGKRFVDVGGARVAYHDVGAGPPVLLLHGCPFSSFVWRKVISLLAPRFRCLAPDLLGLGDTETLAEADWSLPAQARMVLGFLDALFINVVDIVGHDHGGAVAQVIAAEQPRRIRRLVLTNSEAYDNWPSRDERPFIRATQLPILGRLVLWSWSRPSLFRWALRTGRAVQDAGVLTPELLAGYIRANLGDAHRRGKTRRFLAGQLDPRNNRATLDAVPGLKRFDHPTLIVWAPDDPHFGPEWAEKLRRDIPGVTRLELLADTGHLLMEERPRELAGFVAEFLGDAGEPPHARTGEVGP